VRAKRLAARSAELLPVPYFHIVIHFAARTLRSGPPEQAAAPGSSSRCRDLLGAVAYPDRPETTNLPRCPVCSGTMLVIERFTSGSTLLPTRPEPDF
jgi:hypothetical protein